MMKLNFSEEKLLLVNMASLGYEDASTPEAVAFDNGQYHRTSVDTDLVRKSVTDILSVSATE